MCYYGSTDKGEQDIYSNLSCFFKVLSPKIVSMIFHVTCSLSFLLIQRIGLNRSFILPKARNLLWNIQWLTDEGLLLIQGLGQEMG